jgi:predicted GIY-YIG superfamily endonuclease
MKKDKQRLSEPQQSLRETLAAGARERDQMSAGSTWQTAYNARRMNKSLEIYWKDKSAVGHRFWIYRRGTKFNEPCPGIYIYARETSPHKWIPIYIGQTENVNVRLTNHEQQKCVDQNGATHVHVSIVTDEKSRLAIEKDLIQQWKPVCNTQFELIAEEVAEANPDLVVRAEKGDIYTVRYEAVNAMLLDEFLKEHRTVQATIARQQKQIEALTAGLQKVREQLEASKPAPQVVSNP